MAQSPEKRSQHHFARDREWVESIQLAIDEAIGTPADSELRSPTVRVLSVSDSGNRLDVELRFRSGELYCCAEHGCFLATGSAKWWQAVRRHLRTVSDREPPPISMRIQGVVEEGAKLQVHRSFGIPLESKSYTYSHGPKYERDAK